MSDKIKKGDAVTWETSQGKTSGKVVKKLTSPMEIKGYHVAASRDNPEYLVKSEKSGKQAAHKPESLKKQAKAPNKKESVAVDIFTHSGSPHSSRRVFCQLWHR